MSVMTVLSLAMVVMLQQHVTFMSIVQQQSFLTSEAPQIGNLLGRLFGKADHFFVYQSRAAALQGAAPLLTGGGATRLFFQAANQETTEYWIEAQTAGGETALRCEVLRPDGAAFTWTVCEGLGGASFRCDEGVLGVTLLGPHGEEISYYGGSQ